MASLCIVVAAVLLGIPTAVLLALNLDIIPPRLRGRAAGFESIFRVVAVAAAPIAFGILSDDFGLRTAWLATSPALVVSGLVMLLGLRTYTADAARSQEAGRRQTLLELLEERAAQPSVDLASQAQELAETLAVDRRLHD
jgi:MFS family permease